MSETAWLSERDSDDPGRLRSIRRPRACAPTARSATTAVAMWRTPISLAGVGLDVSSRICMNRLRSASTRKPCRGVESVTDGPREVIRTDEVPDRAGRERERTAWRSLKALCRDGRGTLGGI